MWSHVNAIGGYIIILSYFPNNIVCSLHRATNQKKVAKERFSNGDHGPLNPVKVGLWQHCGSCRQLVDTSNRLSVRCLRTYV